MDIFIERISKPILNSIRIKIIELYSIKTIRLSSRNCEQLISNNDLIPNKQKTKKSKFSSLLKLVSMKTPAKCASNLFIIN
jgi:hypothetical protein